VAASESWVADALSELRLEVAGFRKADALSTAKAAALAGQLAAAEASLNDAAAQLAAAETAAGGRYAALAQRLADVEAGAALAAQAAVASGKEEARRADEVAAWKAERLASGVRELEAEAVTWRTVWDAAEERRRSDQIAGDEALLAAKERGAAEMRGEMHELAQLQGESIQRIGEFQERLARAGAEARAEPPRLLSPRSSLRDTTGELYERRRYDTPVRQLGPQFYTDSTATPTRLSFRSSILDV